MPQACTVCASVPCRRLTEGKKKKTFVYVISHSLPQDPPDYKERLWPIYILIMPPLLREPIHAFKLCLAYKKQLPGKYCV